MKRSSALALVAVLGLAACGDRTEEAANTDAAATETTEEAAAAEQAQAPAAIPATVDLSRIPVSTAELGAFPYIDVPATYTVREEKTLDLAAFPIWTGAAFQVVEGKVHMAASDTPDGKTYSRLEFQRGIENAVKALGGVQTAQGEAPNLVIDALPSSLRSDVSLGLGSIYGSPITSYVIRRADKTIWVQVVADGGHAAWAVVEAPVAAPAA